MKRNNSIKIIKTLNTKNTNINNKEGYIGLISMYKNEEFIWQYNNYFEKDKFLKPIDCLDWTAINSNNYSSHYLLSERNYEDSYNLSEGDIFKLGTILFLVRKIKINENKSYSINPLNNSINIENNINSNYRYNKKENIENALESFKTEKEHKNRGTNISYYNNKKNNERN